MTRTTATLAFLAAFATACGVAAPDFDASGPATELASPVVIDEAVPVSDIGPIGEVVDADGELARPLNYTVDDGAGDEFLRLLNETRAEHGLSPMLEYWDLEDDAHAQTERMIDRGGLYHNPDLATVVGPVWSRLGENVGVGFSVAALHQAFLNSPAHYANVVGDFSHVGIGAQRDGQGSLWVTFVFMKSTVDGIERTLGPFVDDDFSIHEAGIAKIAAAGITVGCDSTGRRFCPESPVTRGQMAAFLKRAFALPGSSVDQFVDDDGAWYEGSANALAASGITKGCNSAQTRFCGGQNVTRGQMAVFLTRALGLPAATRDYFDDDAGKFYEDAANRMYESGITRGCGGTRYCGDSPVTRAQMATFLTRALGL